MPQTPIDFPDAAESEVVRILLDFPILFRKSKSLCGWGRKRRRSGWNSPAVNDPHSQAPNPPPPPRAVIPGDTDFPARNRVKSGEGLSPVTPLAFFPSESDDKPSRSHSKKRKLETVMAYYNHQKAYNLKLKARKHELWIGSKIQAEVCESLVGRNTSSVVAHHQQQKYNECLMGQGSQKGPRQGLFASDNGLGAVNHRVGPIGMSDLRVSAQFYGGPAQPLDLLRKMEEDKKARYAEARRSRMIKNRLKKKIRRGSRKREL